eukprot:Skav231823  [mRNA]  locus=scaffold136:32452:33354:+ [translate_table: standard]
MPLVPLEGAILWKSSRVSGEGWHHVICLQKSISVMIKDVEGVVHQRSVKCVVDLEQAGSHEVSVAQVPFAVLVRCSQESFHFNLRRPAP